MQTVLITGAASGIGRASAQRFARSGWRCVLIDRNGEVLDRVRWALPGPGDHLAKAIDLTDTAQIRALAQDMPLLDAVVNNAGMSDASHVPLAEQAPAQLQRLLALNLDAPATLVEALSGCLAAGARVVNVSSGAGLRAIPWRGAYSPGKAGLIAQSKALARSRPDLCVTVLCPGFVRTELVEGLIDAGRLKPAEAVAKTPLGRMALPEEMAEALFFLAGRDAAPLNGQVLSVDGGSSIYGGSAACAPVEATLWPLDAMLDLQVVGDAQGQLADVGVAQASAYRATLDGSALHASSALFAVHEAACRFAGQHARDASLTVLLPAASTTDWREAGDVAAAAMLVSTLACEWGARALRINAVEIDGAADVPTLAPLLRFIAGAGAQYLTGQTLRLASTGTQG